MEDIASPPTDDHRFSEAGHDADGSLNAETEGSSTPVRSPADPTKDTEIAEDTDDRDANDPDDAGGASEDESDLSDLDDAQTHELEAEFDPSAVQIEDRPIPVDESNVGKLGVHKRKREGDEGGEKKKKRKEGRRERPKKSRKRREAEGEIEGAEDAGRRKDGMRKSKKREEDDEGLSPEERRRRALDRAMDAALKNPNRRRRRADGIDLDSMADQEIENMRNRMAEAAQADGEARMRGEPAMHKLRMLPEVVALLSRSNIRNQVVDPDLNLLQSVRFFLEPLSDGSLPAYNIQRDLFSALEKLPINKDALIASGIGKVTLFYTKSKRPEPGIKRMAEKLLGEWTRPILKRTDDYRKREFQKVEYDPTKLPIRSSQAASSQSSATAARERALALPDQPNRAARAQRPTATTMSYTIVPRSNLPDSTQSIRAPGGSGGDYIKRLVAKQKAQGRR